MNIQRSGRSNDIFIEQLAKLLPKKAETEAKIEDLPKEQQLADDRKDKGQEAQADEITEKQLPDAGERKDDPVHQTHEGQLEDERKKAKAAAPNSDKQGITEERLNDADKSLYPHRNEKAHERTGDKRPVNALREEMGNASDEAKRDRYEKANTSGKKRLVDEDVGSQLTNKKTELKAFNLKRQKTATVDSCKNYIDYKNATQPGVKTASVEKFAEVKEIDVVMAGIMQAALDAERELSHDDLAKIAALKDRKTELLIN